MPTLDKGIDGAELRERSTGELVNELSVHGRRLVETEMALLKADLRREIERTRGELAGTRTKLIDEGRAALTQARERLTRNAEALRADLSEQVGRATAAAKPMAMGSVLAHGGLLVLLAALVLGLATFMAAWLAALIVGGVAGAIGAALIAGGARQAKEVGHEPLTRTHTQLMENKQWMTATKGTLTARMRSVRSTLSAIALPRLHLSSGDGRSQST
jgi:predicted phage tail protein